MARPFLCLLPNPSAFENCLFECALFFVRSRYILFADADSSKSRKSQDDDVKSTTSSTSSVKGRKTPAQVKRENAAKKVRHRIFDRDRISFKYSCRCSGNFDITVNCYQIFNYFPNYFLRPNQPALQLLPLLTMKRANRHPHSRGSLGKPHQTSSATVTRLASDLSE